MKQIELVPCMHESNSFNPEKTDYEMFSPLTGDQLVATWIHAHHEVGGILEEIPQQGLEIVRLITAWAMPAGPVRESTYERILREMLDLISAQSLDGLMLSLHGAMVAEHVRDADGETAVRVRQLVGPSLPVGTPTSPSGSSTTSPPPPSTAPVPIWISSSEGERPPA